MTRDRVLRRDVGGRVLRACGRAALAVAVIGFAGLALAQALAQPAEAHATLVRSNPTNQEKLDRSPLRVTLNFSEPIEPQLTKIEVTNSDDERVDDGETAFDDDDAKFASVGLERLTPGLYTVEYSNVSTVDGHPWGGLFEFIILNEDGTVPPDAEFTGASEQGTAALPKPVDAILKWIAMTALAIAAGAAAFLIAVYRPAARFLDDPPYVDVVDAGERWVVNIAHVLLPTAFIASSLLIVVTVSRFETTTTLWDYLTDVRAGQYRGLQLLAIALTLVGADLLFLAPSRRARDLGTFVMVIGGFGALLFYPLVSHAASDAGKFWSIASDYTHIATSALWLGMLVMLPPVLRGRQAEGAPRFLLQANAFDRFSIIAGLTVFAVLTTGTFNALVEIPTWDALTDTTYGRVLLVKLGVVALLLAAAGLNAFILKPRLVAAIDEQYQGDEAKTAASPGPNLSYLQRWLPRTIILEIALVVAVFGSVAVLTQTTSAKSEVAAEEAAAQAGAAYEQTFEQDGLLLTLRIQPNLVGRNAYEVVVQQAEGVPAETVTQVRLRFTYDAASGPQPGGDLQLNEFDPGVYRGEGAYFSQPGNWRVEIGVRRSDDDDVNRTVVLTVQQPSQDEGGGGAFDLPFDSFTWNEVAGVLMILLGVLAVIYRRPLRAMPGHAHSIAMGAAVVLMISGGILAFGVDDHGESADPSAGNPVEPTEESVERGRILYEQNCIVCHGPDGRGDGPNAASLNPAPSDFRTHVPFHTDVELYRFIADGYPGTAMPAWRDEFSETDIWNLVNFLRVNFSEAPDQ